jgi:hypothetical protein
MAEDSRVAPLPRRVPGDRRRPGTGPAAPPALSDADIERIRNALNAAGEQASPPDPAAPPPGPAAPAERLSPLPRRVPSASGHEPPARPVLPPSSPDFLSAKAPPQPPQGIPAVMAGGVTEEIEVRPNGATRPEAAAVAPADPKFVPAQRSPAEERPGGQDRREVGTTSPEKVPVGRVNTQASRSEAQAHWKKALARPPKPALPKALVPPSAPSRPQELASPRRWMALGVILAVVLFSAGSLAFVLTRHAPTAAARTGYRFRASAEVHAASWVASQVNRAATISCDQVMCQALEKRGVPAASLLELRTGQADPLRSGVIVSTAAIRKLIGSEVVTADAPAVIASFGSGSTRIEVREIAQRGAAAYFSALSKDIRERKASGTSLLANPRITVSPTASRQLAAGQVDSRLQVVIAALAAKQPVSIVAFGDLGPGASPGIPFRGAYLAGTGGTAAQVQSMSAFLHGQHGHYVVGHIHPERLAGGRNVLLIEFTAPSPPGLLGPLAP